VSFKTIIEMLARFIRQNVYFLYLCLWFFLTKVIAGYRPLVHEIKYGCILFNKPIMISSASVLIKFVFELHLIEIFLKHLFLYVMKTIALSP